MLRLTTFGGIALTQDARPVLGAAAGQRRLALLALLAEGRQRGVDRESIASLLWPDSEPEQGRHSLHQLLYAMRRAHGDDRLFEGTKLLHLNPASITTDLWDFEAAVGQRRFDEAATLYHGPFANGFSIVGAGELERRFDVIRSRYAREYGAVIERLAGDAARQGDQAGRARWWRLLADAEPLSARAAAELIDALTAAGERAQALQAALRHEALVREEFGATPDPEIVKRILRLRAPPPPGASSDVRTAAPRPDAGPSRVEGPGAGASEDRWRVRLIRALGPGYRIGTSVDEGGMVVTYDATMTDTGQAVAVHVVHPHIAAATQAARFLEVFRKVAMLGAAQIRPILDFGGDEGVLYFVTGGERTPTLRDRLKKERELPLRDAVAIARDMTQALAHAHSLGVWHGDLRPKHIALTSAGATVASFGVVQALAPESEWRATSSVVTFGSPSYMSPEQLMGDVQVDPRSDVYSFGCIVYEMLAGEPPFGRPSRGAGLGRKLTQAPPRLRSVRESAPAALEEIVHTCLARSPADRYASGEALARALAELDAG